VSAAATPSPFRARERHERTNSGAERAKGRRTVPKSAPAPRDGARPGPGRPRTTLLELVCSGSFNASNWRHRELLESEDLPVEAPGIPNLVELRRLQDAYRVKKRRGVGASVLWIARSFTAHLREEVKG